MAYEITTESGEDLTTEDEQDILIEYVGAIVSNLLLRLLQQQDR